MATIEPTETVRDSSSSISRWSATLSVLFFYGLSQKEAAPQAWRSRVSTLPAVLALGAGLAVNNTKAVLEALFGFKSPFIRTPKRGEGAETEVGPLLRRYRPARSLTSWVELALSLHFLYAAYLCLTLDQWFSLPFMILFGWGLGYVGLLSLIQRR